MFTSKNRLEKKIVTQFWNDGLVDVLAGLGILIIGIAWHFDVVPLGVIAPALLVPLWKPLRTKITEPRLGMVELSDPQQHRNRSFLVVSILLGVATLIAGVIVYIVAINRIQFEAKFIVAGLPMILLSFMSFMTAMITASKRFITYGFILVGCGLATIWLGQKPGGGMLIAGSMILLSGIYVLTKFIQRYRIPTDSTNEAKFDV